MVPPVSNVSALMSPRLIVAISRFVWSARRYYSHCTIRFPGHPQNTMPDDREVSFQEEIFWLDGPGSAQMH
jgi:hypothetical protein